MDNKAPEREVRPERARVVKIGEYFDLFPKDYSYKYHRLQDNPIILVVDKGLRLPFDIDAQEIVFPNQVKGAVFLPFGPKEDSYPISAEDFDPKSREEKTIKMKKDLGRQIDRGKNPVDLVVTCDYAVTGLEEVVENLPVTLHALSKLRFLLDAPEARLEADPLNLEDREDVLGFWTFHPADLGPLADIPNHTVYREDGSLDEEDDNLYVASYGGNLGGYLNVALPDDPEKLSKLRGKFVMVEDEPQKEK